MLCKIRVFCRRWKWKVKTVSGCGGRNAKSQRVKWMNGSPLLPQIYYILSVRRVNKITKFAVARLRLVHASSGKYLPHQTNEVDVYGAHTHTHTGPLRFTMILDARAKCMHTGAHTQWADDDAFIFIHALNRFTSMQPTLPSAMHSRFTIHIWTPTNNRIFVWHVSHPAVDLRRVCMRAHTFNRKWWKYLLFRHCRSVPLAWLRVLLLVRLLRHSACRLNSTVVIIHKCWNTFYGTRCVVLKL